jgi:hypothetical protein
MFLADWESTYHQDSSRLDPDISQTVMSKKNALQCRPFCNLIAHFISWRPNPEAIAHNAILHP